MNRRDFVKGVASSLAVAGLAGKLILLDAPLTISEAADEFARDLEFVNNITRYYLAPKYGCGIRLLAAGPTEKKHLWFRDRATQLWNTKGYRHLFEEDLKLSKMTSNERRHYFDTTPSPKWEDLF